MEWDPQREAVILLNVSFSSALDSLCLLRKVEAGIPQRSPGEKPERHASLQQEGATGGLQTLHAQGV